MKKSLIALAAFAATTAFAQSSVTLSGILKGGIASNTYSGSTTAINNGSNTSVSDGSSRFILSGSEDLGGGLKANFQIDTRFRADDSGAGGPVGGGNTFVGLSGGFGAIQLGKLDTHYCMGADTHGSRATSLAASSCSILGFISGTSGATSVAGNTRVANTIRYTTTNMSGFVGQLGYSTGATDGNVGLTSGGNSMNASLNYSNGPVSAGLSFWNQKAEDRTLAAARADQNAYTLMGNYNLGVATVGLTYDNSSVNTAAIGAADSTAKRTAFSIPVTVPMGAGTILATYTKAADRTLNGVSVADTGATMFSLGYDYALSKRTTVGVSYASLRNETAATYGLYALSALNGTGANAAGQKANQLYAGVRHTF